MCWTYCFTKKQSYFWSFHPSHICLIHTNLYVHSVVRLLTKVYLTHCYIYIFGFVNVFCTMYTIVSISYVRGIYFVCMYNLYDVLISHSKSHKAVYLTRCYIYISGFVNVFCMYVSISYVRGTYFVCMYNLLGVHIFHSISHVFGTYFVCMYNLFGL